MRLRIAFALSCTLFLLATAASQAAGEGSGDRFTKASAALREKLTRPDAAELGLGKTPAANGFTNAEYQTFFKAATAADLGAWTRMLGDKQKSAGKAVWLSPAQAAVVIVALENTMALLGDKVAGELGRGLLPRCALQANPKALERIAGFLPSLRNRLSEEDFQAVKFLVSWLPQAGWGSAEREEVFDLVGFDSAPLAARVEALLARQDAGLAIERLVAFYLAFLDASAGKAGNELPALLTPMFKRALEGKNQFEGLKDRILTKVKNVPPLERFRLQLFSDPVALEQGRKNPSAWSEWFRTLEVARLAAIARPGIDALGSWLGQCLATLRLMDPKVANEWAGELRLQDAVALKLLDGSDGAKALAVEVGRGDASYSKLAAFYGPGGAGAGNASLYRRLLAWNPGFYGFRGGAFPAGALPAGLGCRDLLVSYAAVAAAGKLEVPVDDGFPAAVYANLGGLGIADLPFIEAVKQVRNGLRKPGTGRQADILLDLAAMLIKEGLVGATAPFPGLAKSDPAALRDFCVNVPVSSALVDVVEKDTERWLFSDAAPWGVLYWRVVSAQPALRVRLLKLRPQEYRMQRLEALASRNTAVFQIDRELWFRFLQVWGGAEQEAAVPRATAANAAGLLDTLAYALFLLDPKHAPPVVESSFVYRLGKSILAEAAASPAWLREPSVQARIKWFADKRIPGLLEDQATYKSRFSGGLIQIRADILDELGYLASEY